MCGISGIIDKNKNKVSKATLEQMNNIISHRGPDGEGFYLNANIAFGHRRLSIIDLSENGSQPMNWLEKYTITYNGEIYNYIEIKRQLIGLGYEFKTKSDTEVILASYDCWGNSCVNYFNGMWAFAIHDKVKNVVFCSRDRFGVKPFYYYNSPDIFAFGSEIKQLTGIFNIRKLNRNVFFDYFYLGYLNHTNETFFNGINKLPQGHNLIYDLTKNEFTIKKFYELKIDYRVRELNEQESVDGYINLLKDSIKLRLRSDVIVGSCLSGGLDSSFISSYASRIYFNESNKNFKAITAKSIEKKTDETYYAELVAKSSPIDHIITQPTTEDFFKSLEDVIISQEEPVGGPSILMQYFVMKKSKENSCTVMLDGQGGDETLLGYERYFTAYLNELSLLGKIKSFIDISNNSKLTLFKVISYYLYFNISFFRKSVVNKRYSFVKKEYLKYVNKSLIFEFIQYNKNLDSTQYNEITRDQLPSLLNYEDKNSMAHSIETRLPFLDYRVVEFAYSINHKYKIKNGWSKSILRKGAVELLPSEIIWRKNKFGFEAPIETWLSNKSYFEKEIKESNLLNTILEMDKISQIKDNLVLWKLYNIAIWSKKYKIEF